MPTLRQAISGRPPELLELIEKLVAAAQASAAERRAIQAAEARRRHRPPKHGLTLRPGADTPLWNELVRQILPHLKKRGAKAQLARLLGLPRQRLHVCLRAGTATLDAERTLLLLGWLGFFQQGGKLAPAVLGGRPGRTPGAPELPGNL
jgi:hypothetical protein